MIDLKEWVEKKCFSEKPWLILGKGPTFAKLKEIDLNEYNTFSLNHVVREQKVNVAHIIDIDVVEACAEHLRTNCDWLIMPRRPHVSCRPSEILTLEDWKSSIPVLRDLDEAGRLVCYDLSLGEPAKDDSAVEVHYFSSEAALGILARMGAKTVCSLGVDGGRKYGQRFVDLNSETKLVNGQPSFDLQFEKLEKIAEDNQIDYRPLVPPMLVFVGADRSQWLAAKVLEYSIHKHASKPVRVVTMIDLPVPVPKDPANRQRTGFSFSRFAIPKLAKYRDRALYLDSDMLVFSDLAQLWDIEFGKQKVLCTTQDVPPVWKDNPWFHPGRQFSVMLLDCPNLNWDVCEVVAGLDRGDYNYAQLLFDMCLLAPDQIEDRIPPQWNCLEHYEESKSSLIHYTVIPTQPWTYDQNPHGQLWVTALEEAVAAGWITAAEIEEELRRGYLRQSLAYVARLAKNKDTYGEPVPAETPDVGASQRLQRLVKEWRNAQSEARRNLKRLLLAQAELTNTKDKLDEALNETDKFRASLERTINTSSVVEEEYRLRVLNLESDKHAMYKSKTWRLGRLITKPIGMLKRTIKV
jgi:lipopolysaccharide biosynthesis glycosyltransferase